jgi:hypothetical protein
VDNREVRRLKDGLVINLPPAAGAVLDTAASTLRRRLATSDMFADVEVEVNEDTDQLLVALVRYRPGTPARQVASYLEAVWISELRLPGLDAFHFFVEEGHVELEAVTGDQDSGYFLTLHLIALASDSEDFEASSAATARRQAEADASAAKKGWFRR